MALIRINKNPSRRELNVFGATWLVFFALVGGWVHQQQDPPAIAALVWGVAVVVPVIGWFSAPVMRLAYLGISYATFPIGFVFSYVILGTIYYLVMSPLGLVMRLCGHDPMDKRLRADAESYWRPREPVGDVKGYYRQF